MRRQASTRPGLMETHVARATPVIGKRLGIFDDKL